MFSKESGLVKVWVSLVLAGTYKYSQVPNLSNLRAVVAEVLTDTGFDINA